MRARWSAICAIAFALAACTTTTPDAPVVAAKSPEQQQLLARGRALFVSRCIECHALPGIREHSAEAWPALVHKMAARADLSRADEQAIVAYLLAAGGG